MKSTKRPLPVRILALLLCIAMLIGTTFAWFTDSVTSGRNQIVAGNLDVELRHYTDDASAIESVNEDTALFPVSLWEPGVIAFENFVVSNEGTLALKYDLTMNVFNYNTTIVDGTIHNLTEVLKLAVLEAPFTGTREEAQQLSTTEAKTIEEFSKSDRVLYPKGQEGDSESFAIVVYWEPTSHDDDYNINNGETTSDGEPLFVELGVNLVATQKDYEEDSFDNTYDILTKTHDHAYTVQPSGLWKCETCAKFVENTDLPYVMINSKTTLTDEDLTGDNAVRAIPLTEENKTALSAVGMTIIKTNGKTTYSYVSNSSEARKVYIRMQGGDLVVDAPLDTVHRYGKAEDVYLLHVAGNSFHEDGISEDVVMMGSGNVVISDKAIVNDLSVAKYADTDNVTITLIGENDNVGTMAVYTEQSDIKVIKKSDESDDAAVTETTPKAMQASGEDVVIIGNEIARVGTELFDTEGDAIARATAKGNKEAARIVNFKEFTAPANIPDQTVFKVAAFIQVNITDENGINLNENASLVNVGTILNTKDSSEDPSGLKVGENAEIVNYGGFFDALHKNEEDVPDGGIFNKDGQTISNSGEIKNIGLIQNDGYIYNTGEVTNTGTLINNENIVNDGDGAVLDLRKGKTSGDGEITDKNGGITLEEGDSRVARIASTYYDSLAEAIEEATEAQTVVLIKDTTENISISGVDKVKLNLNKNTLTGTLTIYDCDGTTVTNGEIDGQVRIGEHQGTIIKWKKSTGSELYESVTGNHPLAPATNVTLKELTVIAESGQACLYYTNIEDDLTRGSATNYCDNDLYGKYIYKTGYETADQYVNYKKNEVFTAIDSTDSVSVIGGSYSGKFLGNFTTFRTNKVIKGILEVSGGTTLDDASAGRYLQTGSYLVSDRDGSFTVVTQAPASYIGNVGSVYYTYAGGANAAISFARLDEVVTIGEKANAKKELAQGDTFTVVSMADGIKWTGAAIASTAEDPSSYEIVETPDGSNANKRVYSVIFSVVARIYHLNDSRNIPGKDAAYTEYGSLVTAFKSAGAGDYVKLMKDVIISDYYIDYGSNYNKYGLHLSARMAFDLNGHTLTYTGEGTAIICTATTGSDGGSRCIRDTSAEKTGTIYATRGYAFAKYNGGDKNKYTDMTYIHGGTYISGTTNAVLLNRATTFGIDGGARFISLNNQEALRKGTVPDYKKAENTVEIKCSVSDNQYFVLKPDGSYEVKSMSGSVSSYKLTSDGSEFMIVPRVEYRINNLFAGLYDESGENKLANGAVYIGTGTGTTLSTSWTEKTSYAIHIYQSNATLSISINGEIWNGTEKLKKVIPGDKITVSVTYPSNSYSYSRSCTVKNESGKTYKLDTEFVMPAADVNISASSTVPK